MAVAMGLQVKQLKPPMDSGLGNAGVLGQAADTPMGGTGWRTLQCPVEHLGHTLGIMGAAAARALFLLLPCPAGESDGAIC